VNDLYDNLRELGLHARRIYSQTGEEGILERLFALIGTTNRFAIEFGASDGTSNSNVRYFAEQGWDVLMLDEEPLNRIVVQAQLTPDNINDVFARLGVPARPDLLVIDVDGMDYWLWRALRMRARVVMLEINGMHPSDASVTVPYDDTWRYDGTNYYGASFTAMTRLARRKGYVPVHQRRELNLFCVDAACLPPHFAIDVPFTPRNWHLADPDNRPWQSVEEEQ
jgi:hypothetical protein